MYAELSMFRSGAARIGKQSGKRTKTDMHVGDWCTVMVYAGLIEKRSGNKVCAERWKRVQEWGNEAEKEQKKEGIIIVVVVKWIMVD